MICKCLLIQLCLQIGGGILWATWFFCRDVLVGVGDEIFDKVSLKFSTLVKINAQYGSGREVDIEIDENGFAKKKTVISDGAYKPGELIDASSEPGITVSGEAPQFRPVIESVKIEEN